MSVNDPRIHDSTVLFVEQLRLRPYNVISNLNSLLEGSGIQLGFVEWPPQEAKTPHEASIFDHLEKEEQ